ncbi:unnamed protein product [Caretta caretta]
MCSSECCEFHMRHTSEKCNTPQAEHHAVARPVRLDPGQAAPKNEAWEPRMQLMSVPNVVGPGIPRGNDLLRSDIITI